jgi:uncharacterized protein
LIFGTDWPGVPGPRANAQAIADLGLQRETLERVLHKNATEVYALKDPRFENVTPGKDDDANIP